MDLRSLQCSVNDDEFELFRDYIADKSGITIPPEKAYLIETKLSKLMLDAGAESFKEFYDYIISNPDSGMAEEIVNAITINETLWFRDIAPWKVLEETILPKLVEDLALGRKHKARFWFAASSTGQEAYSTVMCVDNYLKNYPAEGVSLSSFDFYATDISSRVLNLAKKGRYDKISIMRGLNDYYKVNYFSHTDSVWHIDDRIRDAVRFEYFNLQDKFRYLSMYDVIFCRYVLIYFSDILKREIAKKIHDSLTDEGILFTGNYVLYDLFKEDFNAHHYDNLTYYTKKGKIR